MMKVARNGSDILYKNDIFALWGINDFGIENGEEYLIENEKLILFEAQNQYYIHDIIPNY
ncbi:MAG: hypothetical protein K2K90_14360 [Lachnospiraceae bacterium]|nr:hypothetical protein [Lachnospiraceae bacterium]